MTKHISVDLDILGHGSNWATFLYIYSHSSVTVVGVSVAGTVVVGMAALGMAAVDVAEEAGASVDS